MSIAVVQRAVGLAAVALLAALGALALAGRTDGAGVDAGEAQPVEVVETGWNSALAGSRGAPRDAERTTCRQILTN
ncbi:MAG: hypothetical protein ACRDNB_12235, partial [Gaiellaceae bacterium]